MSAPEFSRPVTARHLPTGPLTLEADAAERAALTERFGIVGIESLTAAVQLEVDGEAVLAEGDLSAELVQACAVSGEEFKAHLREPVRLRFVRPRPRPLEEDLELPEDEPDEIEYAGDSFDLGEAIAQTLGLAIDPYARGPRAEAARAEAGIAGADQAAGPLAALLAGLRKD